MGRHSYGRRFGLGSREYFYLKSEDRSSSRHYVSRYRQLVLKKLRKVTSVNTGEKSGIGWATSLSRLCLETQSSANVLLRFGRR
jgi:hypothetical protein